MEHPLEGLRAMIGGGSSGIGKGCALAMARAGASVTLTARDEVSLAAALEDLPIPVGQTHAVLPMDSADWAAVDRTARADIGAHGSVDILVNNTGGPAPGQLIEAEPEQFIQAFEMHILSSQALVRAVVPGMKDNGYGRIINIISTSVVTPLANLGVSNTIRGAVAQWARTLSSELAPFGITVNNVLPGAIDTPRLRRTMEGIAKRTDTTVDQVRERRVTGIPAQRLGRPEDVGEVAAFLASPRASYVSGVNLPVDGGKTAIQ